jgi:hypothetical protein
MNLPSWKDSIHQKIKKKWIVDDKRNVLFEIFETDITGTGYQFDFNYTIDVIGAQEDLITYSGTVVNTIHDVLATKALHRHFPNYALEA